MQVQTEQPTLFDIPRLNTLPVQERPAYRISRYGPDAVSKHELLSAVIGGERQLEAAWALLERYGTLTRMCQASVEELARIPGIGPSRAAALKAALELARRLMLETTEDKPQIRSPADAAMLVMPEIGNKEQEHFYVLFLDIRNRVLGGETLYKGTLTQTQVRPADVFREAVRCNAAALIVAHNHPSGDPTPSPEDVVLTRELVAAGRLLGIDVLDHLVIGHRQWVSLRERRLGFD